MNDVRTGYSEWPVLDYAQWRDTGAAVHLWSQIAGKYRLAHTPWVNHSWHGTLYLTTRGLTTGLVPDPAGAVTLDFDFRAHRFVASAESGAIQAFPLESMSVAEFLERAQHSIEAVGGTPVVHHSPNEVPDPAPFESDLQRRPYDAEAVERFHRALLRIERVFSRFRTSFLGKVSPVHLFWGAFDLAVTRFSGRPAPLHRGGIPHLPDGVTREAYSHEVSSAGFWPGGNGVEEAMFYSYAYPESPGFSTWPVAPSSAFYRSDLGEFLLPYEAVRSAHDPQAVLLQFLNSTYEAAAECAHWDRRALECELGRPRVPRALPLGGQ